MNWTQPICEDRWRQMNGDRVPFRMQVPKEEWEPCCYCQRPTNIYVRIDPTTVPYPVEES